METNLPEIKISDALQHRLDSGYLDFLASTLILKNTVLTEKNTDWFLKEIVDYMQKVYPNKSRKEYSEMLVHIIHMANLKD